MVKKTTKKEKGNITAKIISVILALFAFFCVFVIIKNKNHSLISGVIGLVILILELNILTLVKINKEKVKFFSILSLILSILAIPILFKQVIFSYVLVVPAFIFSKKAMAKDSRTIVTKISFFVSIIMLVICITFSLIGGCVNVMNTTTIK